MTHPTTPNDVHLKLWAKSDPYHPLWKHMLDIAAVCMALMPRFGGVDCLPNEWVLFLVALHDVGKADGKFQGKAPLEATEARAILDELRQVLRIADEADCIGFRHEARSAEWLMDYLIDECGWRPRPDAHTMRLACAGHHGNFKPPLVEEEEKVRAAWQPVRRALVTLVADVLGITKWAPTGLVDASAAGLKLVGLTVLADWIASNHEVFDYTQAKDIVDPEAYYAWAVDEAARLVDKMQLSSPASPTSTAGLSFTQIWPACVDLRPTQKALEAVVMAGISPGLAIIEAPMGEGKTECAVYLAEYWNSLLGRSGCYFALPTQATSNQMYDRYCKFLKGRRPEYEARLVHGMAWLVDDRAIDDGPDLDAENQREARNLARDWFSNAKRALLAPEAVGTVDQAMFGALNVKHGFLRLLGLSSRVLIIDECHAYDMYMTAILERLLQWCHTLNIPVILLSATLSRNQKQRLLEAYSGRSAEDLASAVSDDAYPLLTFSSLSGEVSSVPVERDPERDSTIAVKLEHGLLGDAEATADLAKSLVDGGGCVCVLCNTVADAQDTFAAIKSSMGEEADIELILYHARFRAEVRQEIEKNVLGLFGKDQGGQINASRPRKAILVCTQVVEQSLDVDFDLMISQIAPVDLLLQRLGRVHRHKGNHRHGHTAAVLHVLMPAETMGDYGRSARVYQLELLLRTEALLMEYSVVHLPDDFRPLIEACYSDDIDLSIPADRLAKAAANRRDKEMEQHNKARTFLIPEPSPKQFQMAMGEKTVGEAEEGGATSYLRASTRFGDDSMPALILQDRNLYEIALAKKISKADRRRLFRHKVNLSTYRLIDAEPLPGYEKIEMSAPALGGHAVILMIDGCWRGRQKDRDVVIVDDPMLGIVYEEVE